MTQIYILHKMKYDLLFTTNPMP